MKSAYYVSMFGILLYGLSCTNKKTIEQFPLRTDTATNIKISFFPVTSFFKGQLLQFDSLLVTPLHTITISNKTDSEWIKREQLKKLLLPFLFPEINDSNLTKYFKEIKFNDQTLNAITFIYQPITTLPDSINLLTWNVYVNPQTGRISKIFLIKHLNENNHEIIQQLTWKTDKYAEIINLFKNSNGKTELLKREKFIWNFDQ